MKTSLADTIEIEKYLRGTLSPEDSLVFEARLVVDKHLRGITFWQAVVARLTRLHHRRQLKAGVEAVHQKLFHDPAKAHFRDSITRLFND